MTKMINYVKAGFPGIVIVTAEIRRALENIALVAAQTKRTMYYWTFTGSLIDHKTMEAVEGVDQGDVAGLMKFIMERMETKSIVVLQDAHILFQGDADISLIDLVRKTLTICKNNKKTLVFLGCKYQVPAELEKEFCMIEMDLPGREDLLKIAQGYATSSPKKITEEMLNAVVDAATGMTEPEADNAMALSIVETKKLDPVVIAREKSQILKKSGILELIETDESIDTIGGLDILKSWIKARACAFTQKARDYGLPSPRGILIVGIPGTGKSLTAKATASILGRPLIKLDVSKVFAGIVGESESNMRMAEKTAEAMAPCVLMIDEVEKAFSGTKSSNSTDGGTSARVFGSFISWMQDRKTPVFIVATANDVSQLPPEMLRKGRFDEMFFVDLPDSKEREDIWRIQIKKHGRDPKNYQMAGLSEASAGFTGAEIEQAVISGLYHAFSLDREVAQEDLILQSKESIPLSVTMREQIEFLQEWAFKRAKLASSRQKKTVTKHQAVQPSMNRMVEVDADNPF